MDIFWLENSVSRQFLMNAVATLSEQLITINNVVNGFVSSGDAATAAAATITDSAKLNTPTNRSNETLFTKKLINSIRGNVACAHRHGFGSNAENYLYQPNCAQTESQFESEMQPHQLHQQLLQRHPSPMGTTATTIKNIKAIGNIVNLDIEQSGTISTYDCDSNYTTTTATKTVTVHSNYGPVKHFRAQHNVKNDKCNYNTNNNNNDKRSSTRATSAQTSKPDSNGGDSSHLNRINIDSPMNIAAISTKNVFHAQFDKHAQSNRNQWWKNLVIVICYLFLLSSSLRICSANKHEGNFIGFNSIHSFYVRPN